MVNNTLPFHLDAIGHMDVSQQKEWQRKREKKIGETENERGESGIGKKNVHFMSKIYVILGWSRTKRKERKEMSEMGLMCNVCMFGCTCEGQMFSLV